MTVHAPHPPSPHPSFVPVRPIPVHTENLIRINLTYQTPHTTTKNKHFQEKWHNIPTPTPTPPTIGDEDCGGSDEDAMESGCDSAPSSTHWNQNRNHSVLVNRIRGIVELTLEGLNDFPKPHTKTNNKRPKNKWGLLKIRLLKNWKKLDEDWMESECYSAPSTYWNHNHPVLINRTMGIIGLPLKKDWMISQPNPLRNVWRLQGGRGILEGLLRSEWWIRHKARKESTRNWVTTARSPKYWWVVLECHTRHRNIIKTDGNKIKGLWHESLDRGRDSLWNGKRSTSQILKESAVCGWIAKMNAIDFGYSEVKSVLNNNLASLALSEQLESHYSTSIIGILQTT